MRHSGWSFTLIAAVLASGLSYGQPASAGSPNDQLFSRIYGCEAAGAIGSAMERLVQGMSRERIEQTYGSLERLGSREEPASRRPQRFGPDWVNQAYQRGPGMTEEGMERQRLITSAIIRKNGRVNVEDVARQWLEDIDPSKFGFLLGPQDRIIYDVLKAGLPPWDAGRYAPLPGLIGGGRMMMPVGLVNACRPDEPARDALDIGRMMDVQGRPLTVSNGKIVYNCAIEVGAAIAAATAEALRPNATVSSVVETALVQLPPGAREEVEMGIGWTRKVKNWQELESLYRDFYQGKPPSAAVEVLSGSLACLILSEGRPREAILCGASLGRDSSSRAHLAGGWAGALRGIQAVPAEWVEVAEKEVVNDPYTVSRRTARQSAEGIHRACLNEMRKAKATNAGIASMLAK
jgi:ADP-ribosylglycohydrolase